MESINGSGNACSPACLIASHIIHITYTLCLRPSNSCDKRFASSTLLECSSAYSMLSCSTPIHRRTMGNFNRKYAILLTILEWNNSRKRRVRITCTYKINPRCQWIFQQCIRRKSHSQPTHHSLPSISAIFASLSFCSMPPLLMKWLTA